MVQKSPSNAPEAQKFSEAQEFHNDNLLSWDIIKFSAMIAKWQISELKNTLKSYNIGISDDTGSSVTNTTLEQILINIDFQNRAKDGRTSSLPTHNIDQDRSVLIKNKSNLAKLIQIYIIAHDASVQKSDFAKSLQWVDGNLERFTMQGLAQVIAGIKTRTAIDRMKDDIDGRLRSGPIKAMWVDVATKIQRTGDMDENLRKRREMSIDVNGDILRVGSYKNISTLDLKTGKMIFEEGLFTWKEYSVTIQLVRDRDNKNNPLMIESEISRENIKNAMKLMNLVHYVVSEFMNDSRKSTIRDREKPFIIVNGILKIDDGLLSKTDIVSREKLEQLMTDAKTNTYENPKLIASFLNEIFRSKNPVTIVDRWSIYIWRQKPISTTP